jgi:hypothetical protein
MPRKTALIPPVAPVAEEKLLRDAPVNLTLDERTAFRAALASPGFQKALKNIRHGKPSVFTGELNSPQGAVIANNRLHEIRGWEMFEAALGAQAIDPVLKPARAREEFIDESALPPTKK